jgi:hypothetical protein
VKTRRPQPTRSSKGGRSPYRLMLVNADQRRGVYIFTASIIVLLVAFILKWWLA